MNKQDLMAMLAAAEEITIAAKKHEDRLRLAAEHWDDLPDTSDYVVCGEAFTPLSKAMANWRGLMATIFPLPEPKPEDETEIAQWLSGNPEQVRDHKSQIPLFNPSLARQVAEDNLRKDNAADQRYTEIARGLPEWAREIVEREIGGAGQQRLELVEAWIQGMQERGHL